MPVDLKQRLDNYLIASFKASRMYRDKVREMMEAHPDYDESELEADVKVSYDPFGRDYSIIVFRALIELKSPYGIVANNLQNGQCVTLDTPSHYPHLRKEGKELYEALQAWSANVRIREDEWIAQHGSEVLKKLSQENVAYEEMLYKEVLRYRIEKAGCDVDQYFTEDYFNYLLSPHGLVYPDELLAEVKRLQDAGLVVVIGYVRRQSTKERSGCPAIHVKSSRGGMTRVF